MESMELAVLCDVCDETNDLGRKFCIRCNSRLSKEYLGRDEALKETVTRRRRLIRRKVLGWSIISSVILLLLGWWGASKYLPLFFIGDPTTSITVSTSAGDWPMYHKDQLHSGFSADDERIPKGALKWKLDTERQLFASPAVVDDIAYLGTGDRRLLAVNGLSGNIIWDIAVSDPVHSTPAVTAELVFFTLLDGRILALDKNDGGLVWEFNTGASIVSSPAVLDGFLYVGSSAGEFYAIDASNGEKIWKYSTGRWIGTSPAVFEDVVVIVSYDGLLHVLDRFNGRKKLHFRVTGNPKGSASFGVQHMFIGDPSGALKAVDWNSRNLFFDDVKMRIHSQLFVWGVVNSIPRQRGFLWGVKSGSGIFSTPSVGDGKVIATDFSGKVIAVNETDGKKLWLYETNTPIASSPSATSRIALVGDTSGTLHALDASTGQLLWDYHTGAQISATPVIAGGLIYLASEDGTLYVLE